MQLCTGIVSTTYRRVRPDRWVGELSDDGVWRGRCSPRGEQESSWQGSGEGGTGMCPGRFNLNVFTGAGVMDTIHGIDKLQLYNDYE